MEIEINGYTVMLRNSGYEEKWCVYAKRTKKRNAGSNLVLQIPVGKNGVSVIIPQSQQKKKLAIIIEQKLGGKK